MSDLDVTIITGMSGRGALVGGRRARGPRLLRDRQPAARAHPEGRRARPRRRQATSRFALVVDVALRRVHRRRSRRRSRELREMGAQHPRRASSTPPTACSCAASRRRAAAIRSRRRRPRRRTGIARERALLEELKGQADLDRRHVRHYNVHELRDRLVELFGDAEPAASGLQMSIVSFGYKHGVPLDVDLLFDCRFLPNPHWVDGCVRCRAPTARPRVRARAARGDRVPRRARAAVRAPAPGVRARGQGVPRRSASVAPAAGTAAS